MVWHGKQTPGIPISTWKAFVRVSRVARFSTPSFLPAFLPSLSLPPPSLPSFRIPYPYLPVLTPISSRGRGQVHLQPSNQPFIMVLVTSYYRGCCLFFCFFCSLGRLVGKGSLFTTPVNPPRNTPISVLLKFLGDFLRNLFGHVCVVLMNAHARTPRRRIVRQRTIAKRGKGIAERAQFLV